MRLVRGLILALFAVAAAPCQTLSTVGTMAHFQSGDGWRTTFFVFNTGTVEATAQLSFYQDSGQPAIIPLRLPRLGLTSDAAAVFNFTMKAGTVLEVESDSTEGPGITGWTRLQSNSTNVAGYLVFRFEGTVDSGVQEGVAPLETRSGKSYVLGFDNTNGHFATFAVANVTNQPVDVTVTAYDGLTGGVLGYPTTLTLPAMGHGADALSNILPYAKFASGTVEFSTPSAGQISLLGLRFTLPSYAFTSTPPIMKQ